MPAPLDRLEASLDTTPLVLVWIDSRESSIVRCTDGDPAIDHLLSDVPPHRRARGNQQHGPAAAGGDAEPPRLEHLARFLREVSQRVPTDADVVIVGPGTVRWRLTKVLHEQDVHRGLQRAIRCRPAPRWTERQLLAEYRRLRGAPSRRRTVGAYRWSGAALRRGTFVLPTRVRGPEPGSRHERATG